MNPILFVYKGGSSCNIPFCDVASMLMYQGKKNSFSENVYEYLGTVLIAMREMYYKFETLYLCNLSSSQCFFIVSLVRPTFFLENKI